MDKILPNNSKPGLQSISIDELKQMDSFKGMTDEQLEAIVASVYTICALAYNAWAGSQDMETIVIRLEMNNKNQQAA